MCVELRMATDPSVAFHAGWYALVFALAKTRLSAVDERQVAANGATANRCENCLHQMIALAKSAGSVPGGQRVPEGTVRGLEPAELERPRRVVVDGRRQVDVEVRAVADGEVLEPEDVRAGRRLDDRGRAAAEMEVVGAVERSGGDPARGERRRDRRRCLGRDRRWRSGTPRR